MFQTLTNTVNAFHILRTNRDECSYKIIFIFKHANRIWAMDDKTFHQYSSNGTSIPSTPKECWQARDNIHTFLTLCRKKGIWTKNYSSFEKTDLFIY